MNWKPIIKWAFSTVPAFLLISFTGFSDSALAWDYGSGRHGSYVLTASTTIEQLYQAVRLTNDPAQYNPADSNAIPNFQNLIITNGATLMASAWNGTTGGVIYLKVQATLSIASGSSISASGIGYRGGGQSQQGESYAGGQTTSPSANYGGGGGGYSYGAGGELLIYSGGGGGYGSGGGNGSSGQGGGLPYGTSSLGTLYLGSGGGGGYNGGPNGLFGATINGGNGGGAIQLQAGNLQVQGQIHSDGGGGGGAAVGGGGGSGGSIQLLAATATLGTNLITANGGGGGYNGGANGGVGRIMIGYAENFAGATTPSAYILNDTNSDNVTVIISQPMTQTNFLAANVNFSVGAYGLPTLLFQWNFNGIPISGATNQTLSLNNLALTNTGYYSVTISNAVMTITSSNAFLKVLDTAISFDDGIPNWWLEQYGLSTNDPTLATNYPPGDQLTYLEKYLYGLNPLTNDTDGDGLTDYDEIYVYHTNPLSPNTAGDGIPDGWKVQYSLNPSIADANSEAGFDGLTYMQIYQYNLAHTNQLNPNQPFAVGSGFSNYEIINNGQHTNTYYYDHEDRLLGMESSKGISIGYQYDGNGNLLRQSVLSRNAETNGLPLLWLWLNGLTNQPGIAFEDNSGNGWDNYQEWLAGLNPNSNSVPSLLNNPGTNIATPAVPFTPTNWVMAAGPLNGMAGDEVVVGADGDATRVTNSVFILTQGPSSWQMSQVPIGAYGITSIAVGQPTNQASPAIYLGLRQTGEIGAIWQLIRTNGLWQTNVLAVSTNSAAYVLGVRSMDVLASFATNGSDGALWSLTYSNGIWRQTIVSTNTSHRGLGNHALISSGDTRDSSMRLLDTGGIEIIGGNLELFVGGYQMPSNSVYYSATGKWYYQTPSAMNWPNAEVFCQTVGGNLVTIQNNAENTFVTQNLPNFPAWIGLYGDAWTSLSSPGPIGWASGASDSYSDFVNCGLNPIWSYAIQLSANYAALINTNGSCGGNGWYSSVQSAAFFGIGETIGASAYFTNQWLLPEFDQAPVLDWRGGNLSSGHARESQTNTTSIFHCNIEDMNSNGVFDAGDNFVTTEYVISGNLWATNTLIKVPITSGSVAQSFGLAAANFTGMDSLFTGEPDGRVYSWTATNNVSPLQRQLFSDAYVGKAWQAMSGIKTAGIGTGLAGLFVNQSNQNTCSIIYWQPQAALPSATPSIIETAPYAAVIPTTATLGGNASVTIRLWHNEGVASTPFLQFQYLGSTNWINATLTTIDGAAYSPTTRVAALPIGSSHTVTWNALADAGPNLLTNILLRACAQDFMLTGNWSLPTPFQLNTAIVSNPTNSSVNFTGIAPSQSGIKFNWSGSSNAWLYLQRSPTLSGTSVNWVNIWTGAPPTPISGSYTDSFGTNPTEFYRMKIGGN